MRIEVALFPARRVKGAGPAHTGWTGQARASLPRADGALRAVADVDVAGGRRRQLAAVVRVAVGRRGVDVNLAVGCRQHRAGRHARRVGTAPGHGGADRPGEAAGCSVRITTDAATQDPAIREIRGSIACHALYDARQHTITTTLRGPFPSFPRINRSRLPFLLTVSP